MAPMEFDVKTTGLRTGQYNTAPVNAIAHADPLTEARMRSSHILKSLAEQMIIEQPQLGTPGSSFHPFVSSAGGLADS